MYKKAFARQHGVYVRAALIFVLNSSVGDNLDLKRELELAIDNKVPLFIGF